MAAKFSDTGPATRNSLHLNALGQVLSVDTPEFSQRYTYDSVQRLATVTDSRGGKTLTYHHSPGGLLGNLEDDAFWNEVDKVMPDYRERKEWLRKHGASFTV